MMQKQHNSGFTLIEMMIVVAIIGILAAIAQSHFQSTLAKSSDKAAQSDARNFVTGVAAQSN